MQLYLTMSLTDTTGKELRQGGVSAIGGAMSKIYLAEHDPQHHSWAMNGVEKAGLKLRILVSYHYYKNTDLDKLFEKYFPGNYPDVFCDSGAYSAESMGTPIDIDAYAEWVKKYRHLFAVHSNLDVIGDPAATLENQRYLEGRGLEPLPVFHVGEDFKLLEEYIEEYQYIALGGMVPHMRYTKRIMPWILKCFRIADGRSVFHGFGATSWKIISQLPWYSVDSSSWGQGFRFGQLPIFDEIKGRFYKVDLGNYKHAKKHAAIIKRLGFNPLDFADRERNDRAKICAISAISYMLAEQWLRNKFGEIRIPDDDSDRIGLRSHLVTAASTSNMSVNSLAEVGDISSGAGVRLHLSDTSNGVNLGDANEGLKLYGTTRSAVNAEEAMSCRQIGTNIYLADPGTDIQHLAKVMADE